MLHTPSPLFPIAIGREYWCFLLIFYRIYFELSLNSSGNLYVILHKLVECNQNILKLIVSKNNLWVSIKFQFLHNQRLQIS